jgi:splicing factor 3A subunit 1
MPNINAQDFEVVKLTALFVAKNGRSWMTQLSQREAGNYQFDFLRPQHSLYQFFTRLIDQYQLLLTGSTVDGGKAEKVRIAELEENAKNKFNILGQAKKRAEWVKYQEAQKAKKEELEESERLAYAQIDWHDFSLVGEITFGPEDEQIELPPPTSLNDLQSASLEQKGRYKLAIEEKPPTDDTPYYNATMAPAPAVQMPPPMPFFPGQPPPMLYPQQPQQPPPQMVQANEEEARIQERQAERERTNQAMAAAKAAPGPMRIVSGAAPRAAAAARRRNIPMAQCPNCKQQIPYDELDQHMKSEPPNFLNDLGIFVLTVAPSRTS